MTYLNHKTSVNPEDPQTDLEKLWHGQSPRLGLRQCLEELR